jgi:hypothetical protein
MEGGGGDVGGEALKRRGDKHGSRDLTMCKA